MEDKKIICAAYIRASTDDQLEYSPDSQIREIRKFAEREGYLLPEEYIFQDDGISGKKADKRPAFVEMIALAKAERPPFQAIIVWEFSRFARNQEESIMYKKLLLKKGITVKSIREPLADSPFSSLIERIIEWMDEYYLINLAIEVRRGMTERAQRGLPNSVAPYGYQYYKPEKDKGGNFVIQPEEAEIVRTIYRDFLNGKAIYKIASELNERGLTTRKGKVWENRTVRYILTNPAYTGTLRWRRDGVNDYHKPQDISPDTIISKGHYDTLISESDFNAAQQKLTAYVQKYGSRGKKMQREKVSWSLQGLVKCSACGATLSRTTHTWANCSGYTHAKCAESHFASIDKLESWVLSAVRNELTDLLVQPVYRGPMNLEGEEVELQQKLQKEETLLARYKEAYAAGVDTLEEYKENKTRTMANIRTIQKKMQELFVPKPFDGEEYCRRNLALVDSIEKDDLTPQEKNEMYRTFIDYIVFDKAQMKLAIHYYYS